MFYLFKKDIYQFKLHKRIKLYKKLSGSSQFSQIWSIAGVSLGTQEIRCPLYVISRKKETWCTAKKSHKWLSSVYTHTHNVVCFLGDNVFLNSFYLLLLNFSGFFLSLLRYIVHVPRDLPFKVYKSVLLSKFTVQCDHHYGLILEYFHHPRKKHHAH